MHDSHSYLPEINNHTNSQLGKNTNKLLAKLSPQVYVQGIKTYRLAIAGTAEYTASQGGTKARAFASMVTTINRVNQVYQTDLGIQLELVGGEEIIYTDPTTDPYTDNSAGSLLSENINNLSENFGVEKFDIGHVFSSSALGGFSLVGVACMESTNGTTGQVRGIKAAGVTGVSGSQSDIYYVAHEIGHQLGATHSFNSTQGYCASGRVHETAVEPGSGSSIMSYSGFCGSDDIQSNNDVMFHGASISQISDYTRAQEGGQCGTNHSSTGSPPSVSAGEDITIPASTPYILDGTGSGASYTWDQMDAGSASQVSIDSGDNAIVRTLLPSGSPDRYIPRLTDLFSNRTTLGEMLPQTDRTLNFALIARGAGIGSDSKVVTVVDTGAIFNVLSQSTSQNLSKGKPLEVLWEVAGTDVTPIACSEVDIRLLRADGVENILLDKTSNDGSEIFDIPLTTPDMSGARIMVACSNKSFFQISKGSISIQKPIVDSVPPVIRIIGANPLTLIKGANYIEKGASVFDNIDKNLLAIVIGEVDATKVGQYKVTIQRLMLLAMRPISIEL